MRVRAKKAAGRKGQVAPQQPAQTFTFPAPKRGWVLDRNILEAPANSAVVLDNWFCTTTGVRVRGGSSKFANLGDPVESLFTYRSGGLQRFYGATATDIYEISAVGDVDVVPTADVTGQTSGNYSVTSFGASGGNYLYAVNGSDDAQLFDGTSWQAVNSGSSPISITGVTTSDLSAVWSFASRLFFVEKDTMTAWYLSVGLLGGAASSISLAGVFNKGGSLLFGATWSLDAGDGLDDKCVFVSTEGEVAIYEGTNPGDASTWRLAGVYEVTSPLGKNAFMQAGGDLLIATSLGMVPISAAVQKDPAALSPGAVTAPIAPYWTQQVGARVSEDWQVLKWPEENMLVVSQPEGGPENGSCLVANLLTGAWSRFTGWDTQALGHFNGVGYFGSSDGYVYTMESGGSDNGATYTPTLLYQHATLPPVGVEKTVLQARATFTISSPINPKVSALVDYSTEVSPAPNSVADYTTDTWDSGLWDTAIWDGGGETSVSSQWFAIGRTGPVVAPEIQLTFGITPKPRAELAGVDVTYRVGALVA